MVTTESLNSATAEQESKDSQLQVSVKHDHVRTRRQTQKGLALCHSVAHWWVLARTPTVHQCLYGGWPWVARSKIYSPTIDKRQQTKTSLESNVLCQPGAVRHLESYMVAEQRDDHMADESTWRRPGSSRRSRRETKPIIQEKINHVTKHTKRNETTHIKITQNQYTDKVVDVSVERQGQDPQIQTTRRKSWRRKPSKWIWVGPPIR